MSARDQAIVNIAIKAADFGYDLKEAGASKVEVLARVEQTVRNLIADPDYDTPPAPAG